TVNGQSKTVDTPPDMPLLWVLRDVLNMKGTKFGCGIGQGGACTVQSGGQARRACQTQISAVNAPITTIEGLSADGSHPLQKAWLEVDVPQCGYCQAGQLMTAAALLASKPKPTDAEIDSAMTGNVCRCGTYLRNREAIHLAANGGRRAKNDAMKKMNKQHQSRSFIKVSALAGGGILIGFYTENVLLAQQRGAAPPVTPINPNTYIKVHPDNTFTIVAKNPETGQGIRNSLPTIIADEFDIDWKQVKIEQSDRDDKYARDMGAPTVGQREGGSTATPQNYQPMRNVGATARAMMVAAAAKRWNVPAAELPTDSGIVTHTPTKRTATYASLAETALTMPVPDLASVKLKDPKDFKIMGKDIRGVDNFKIVTGQPS